MPTTGIHLLPAISMTTGLTNVATNLMKLRVRGPNWRPERWTLVMVFMTG